MKVRAARNSVLRAAATKSQRSYFTTSKSDDSYRDRTWPLPKVTTVAEIVLDHFKKATTVTEIVLDHFQKWRQLQRSYFSVLQKWRQSQRSSPNRSFRARLPSKTNLQSQFLTTVTRGKPEASPRQARGRLNPPFRGAYFRRRSSALFLAKHSISRAGYLPKSYFKLQKWQQSQRSYFTTSKSDDSYRDRTWPLQKVTTVTEIVLDHFQKWRQLQRSYFSVLQKWRQSQRSSPNRSFRARLPSKTNLQSQFLTTVTRGKPGASPRQARGRLNPPFRGAYFRRRSSALFLAKHSISRAGYLPKSYFKLQKWQQSQRSYFTTSKSDDSYRDRTWPLPKVTTVTEIVLDHFQKWRQLQRSYLTTSKSDDS